MTDHDAIAGVDRCSCRRSAQDVADAQVWALLEARHPGLMRDVYGFRGPGESLYVPKGLESPRERARRLDDGVMSVRMLAIVAEVGYETARRARNEKGRE